MQNASHTPGPWHVWQAGSPDNDGSLSVYDRPTGHLVARVEWFGLTDVATGHFQDEEAQANARLIAAAPELLAALLQMLRCFDPYDPTDEQAAACDAAKAAIARVMGK